MRLIVAGMDRVTVCSYLGHSSEAASVQYTHEREMAMDRDAEAMDKAFSV